MSSIKRSVLRIVGSSDLIGNPYNFVSTLGSGFSEIYYAPKEGAMQGPAQAGLGVAKGIGTAGRSAAGATSGVVGKVTGSLGGAIEKLSFD